MKWAVILAGIWTAIHLGVFFVASYVGIVTGSHVAGGLAIFEFFTAFISGMGVGLLIDTMKGPRR